MLKTNGLYYSNIIKKGGSEYGLEFRKYLRFYDISTLFGVTSDDINYLELKSFFSRFGIEQDNSKGQVLALLHIADIQKVAQSFFPKNIIEKLSWEHYFPYDVVCGAGEYSCSPDYCSVDFKIDFSEEIFIHKEMNGEYQAKIVENRLEVNYRGSDLEETEETERTEETDIFFFIDL